MHIVMGATGHVGGAVAEALLDRGENVTVVTRVAERASRWRERGAAVAEASADDVEGLRAVFATGTRAFLLNPLGDPSGDTDAAELRSGANIVAALEGTGLEKIVAQSTYGARSGDRLGDLGTLWEFEERLRAQPIPVAIDRGAYFFTNWDAMLDAAREGTLPSMMPADLVLPMVDPADLGRAAAERMLTDIDDVGVQDVEGPVRYSANDVAAAFAAVLGRPVSVSVTPRDRLRSTYRELGFSEEAAESFARMTEVSIDGDVEPPADPRRMPTTIEQYLRRLVENDDTGGATAD